MRQKVLLLGRIGQLLRVTVRCPHGVSADFEYPVPRKGPATEARRRTVADTIRHHRHTWRLIEQGQSIFGRCRLCMAANAKQAA